MKILIIFLILVLVLYFVMKSQNNKNRQVHKNGNGREENVPISFKESTTNVKYYFIFDCETTGLPIDRYASETNFENWPYPVQIAWLVLDQDFGLISKKSFILKQPVSIPKKASDIHKITNSRMRNEGVDPKTVYSEFIEDISNTSVSIAHNTAFDVPIIKCDMLRNGFTKKVFIMKNLVCTMMSSTNICKIKNPRGGYKWPKLEELFGYLFYNNTNISIDEAHDAMNDVLITAKCYIELKRRNQI